MPDVTEIIEVKLGDITLLIEVSLKTPEEMVKHHIQSASVPISIDVNGQKKYPVIKWKVQQPQHA